MPILSLNEAKDELGVVGNDDDARVQSLLNGAISSAANYINRTIPWKDEAGVDVEVPDDVSGAIRLELRALDHSPDSVHGPAFKSLLNPYRVY